MLLNPNNPDFLKLTSAVKEFEGWADHFYLDTVGNVTIGIGHLCPSVDDAPLLGSFSRGSLGATDVEVRQDYSVVKVAPAPRVAQFYAPMCVSRLAARSIERLFSLDLQAFQNELIEAMPGFTALPIPAQSGLLDMAFNMGVPRLTGGFPKLMASILDRDFATAAAECARSGDDDNTKRRNEWTRRQFIEAQQAGAVQRT